MTPKRTKARPLAILIADRVGFRKGIKVLTFIITWGAYIEKFGEPPETIDELVEAMGGSRATAFREQRLFREAFPDEETPTRIWTLCREQVDPTSEAAPLLLGGISIPVA